MPQISQFGCRQEFDVADILTSMDFAGFAARYEDAGIDDEGASFTVPTPEGLPPASVGGEISRDNKKITVQVAARLAENLSIDEIDGWQDTPEYHLVEKCCYDLARQFHAYLRLLHGNGFCGNLGCDRE